MNFDMESFLNMLNERSIPQNSPAAIEATQGKSDNNLINAAYELLNAGRLLAGLGNGYIFENKIFLKESRASYEAALKKLNLSYTRLRSIRENDLTPLDVSMFLTASMECKKEISNILRSFNNGVGTDVEKSEIDILMERFFKVIDFFNEKLAGTEFQDKQIVLGDIDTINNLNDPRNQEKIRNWFSS